MLMCCQLLFGCEAWTVTQKQLDSLERVHASCLRRILGLRVSGHHKLEDIRERCNTVSLAEHITAARFRWLGHVLRMEHNEIPHIALFSSPWGRSRPVGGPPLRWTSIVLKDLKKHKLPTNMHDLLSRSL